MTHTFVHQDVFLLKKGFLNDALFSLWCASYGNVYSTMAAMSTMHPSANPALAGQDVYKDEKIRNKQIHRLLGCAPTIAA